MAKYEPPTLTAHQEEVIEAALRFDPSYFWSDAVQEKARAILKARDGIRKLGQKKQKLIQIIVSFVLSAALLGVFVLFLLASPFQDLPWIPYVLLGLSIIMAAFGAYQLYPYSKYDVRLYDLRQEEAKSLNELLECIEKENL